MAKVVIAGKANCPYFARVELLADELVKNLPNFNLHKILIQPTEWEEWLKGTCDERNWTHTISPLVWRELVDRGGKGLYIGGANEFQEYAKIYYDVSSSMISDLQLNIAQENYQTKIETDEELKETWAVSNLLKVCISSAHHPTCYSLVSNLVSGQVFGREVELSLHLLTNEEQEEEVKGMQMEVMDLCHPLARETIVSTSISESFQDCQLIVFLDEVTKVEEPRPSWLKMNRNLFENYGELINNLVHKDCKVLVAGDGPVNFNADVLIKSAPNIAPENIVALSRTVENQAKAIIAGKLNVNTAEVVDVIVWGDPSANYHADVSNGRVHNYDGAIWGPPFYSRSCVEMLQDNKWIATKFPEQLQERRQIAESMLQHKTAMSQAAAIESLLKHWWNGSPEEQVFSLGVRTDGSNYDIPAELVFSLPVKFTSGSWHVVENLKLDEEIKQKIKDISQAVKLDFDSVNSRVESASQTTAKNPEDQQEINIENVEQSVTEKSEIETDEKPPEAEQPASTPIQDTLEESEQSNIITNDN